MDTSPSSRCRHGLLLAVALLPGCLGRGADPQPLTALVPLHLEDHLDVATIVGSDPPSQIPVPIGWSFAEPQPDWKPVAPLAPAEWEPVQPVRVDDALRLPLRSEHRNPRSDRLVGEIYVPLPDLEFGGWGYVEIRARTADPMFRVGVSFNYTEQDPVSAGWFPFFSPGPSTFLVTDGTEQTYRLPLYDPRMRTWEGRWKELGVWFNSQEGADGVALELLSIRLIPVAADFASEPAGVLMHGRAAGPPVRDAPLRRSLYVHARASFIPGAGAHRGASRRELGRLVGAKPGAVRGHRRERRRATGDVVRGNLRKPE